MIVKGRYAKGHIPPHEREVQSIAGRVPTAVHHSVFLSKVGAPAASALPQSVALQHVVYDQGAASSCWGFGYYKQLVEIRAIAEGWLDAAPVSALAGYGLGREYGLRDGGTGSLEDTGTDPTAGVAAMCRFGIVSNEALPYSDAPDVIARRMSLMTVERGACARTLDLGFIDEPLDGPQITTICQSLAAGYPVAFGMTVDDAYENLRGSTVYEGLRGPSLGGHAQCFFGYHIIGDSVVVLDGVGSWGTGFADGGDFHIKASALSDRQNYFDPCMARVTPYVRATP